MDKIPFVDLYAQYLSIKKDIDAAIETTIRNTAFINPPVVKEFEQAFASWLGIKHVIGCANGTDSIEILLQAYGIGKGDEVLVPAITWISTSEAVSTVGATPVFVDIEPDHYTIDANLIEKAITKKTKAIIPVHLYGHPADMPAIMKIAAKHNLVVIEDCAQAHGATIHGQTAGTFGHAASFSFYPGKNLGAYGDAGGMATNDDKIAEKARMIAQHGQKGKHNHLIEGRNSRLDGLQAAILKAKLPYLKQWTEARIQKAAHYDRLLQDADVVRPQTKDNYRPVFHLYVIRCTGNSRERIQSALTEQKVETAIHYPTALPFLPCYAHRGHQPADFPVAALYQTEILSLPIYPEISAEALARVAQIIKEVPVTA
jgi:dTDP-4-amino-4,6-dideoxygalactose transaminase